MNKEEDCFIPFIMKNFEYETIVYFYLRTADTNNALPAMAGSKMSIRIYMHYLKLCYEYRRKPVLYHPKKCFGIHVIFCQLEFGRKYMHSLTVPQVEKLIQLALNSIRKNIEVITDIWYEPELASYIRASRIHFPLSFLKEVYLRHIKDGILVVRDGEQAESFVWEIYEMLNYLFVFTDEEEKWEELERFAYEHTGLIIQYNSAPMHLNRGNRALHYFDFSDRDPEDFRMLPKGTIYFDFAMTKEKQRIIEGKRKDIRYVSFPKCLDTCAVSAL